MLKNFKQQEVKTFNGLEMFLYQGQKSFYLWNRINPEVNDELKRIITGNLK
jgi:shikimate 5-dehydrogenase